MVLYVITLVTLAKEFRTADLGLISLFFADDAAFNDSARRSSQLLKMLMEMDPDRGYFTYLTNSLFI